MAFDKVVDSQALDGALGAVADAIRGKTGSAATLTLEQMPGAISGIQTGSGAELPELSNPGSAGDLMEGKQLIDGAGRVVDGTFTLAPELAEQAALIDEIRAAVQSKTVAAPVIEALEITENGVFTAPEGVDGYSPISVHVPVPEGYVKPEGTLDITENGEYDVAAYAAASVQVAGGGGGDPEMPPGYRRCDFIRFNDAQIVDTGIICNQNTKIKVMFTREASDAMYMYGVINDGNTASVTAYLSSGGSWRFGAKSSSRNITVSDDIIHTAVVQKSGITSDTGNSSFSGVEAFETIGSLIIGSVRNASGTVAAAQFVGRIFLFEMWDGSEQVLKLIPVTDGSQYRFWDAIGEKFHDSITTVPLDGGNW